MEYYATFNNISVIKWMEYYATFNNISVIKWMEYYVTFLQNPVSAIHFSTYEELEK